MKLDTEARKFLQHLAQRRSSQGSHREGRRAELALRPGPLPEAVAQKLRDAQKAFGAGDCGQALPTLREVLAADPQNYVAHLLTAHCSLRGSRSDTTAAGSGFVVMVVTRRDSSCVRLTPNPNA